MGSLLDFRLLAKKVQPPSLPLCGPASGIAGIDAVLDGAVGMMNTANFPRWVILGQTADTDSRIRP